ncbi:methyl-accepting chemotaxis protein [Sporomusa sp.]|uniref:methyl-accepting chemotaxis protein n=1 Tax=Sporomusa sp. TaxID=2078658 RepID=UPI002B8C9A97|nr:methyl-accepting chemotaxis protein [Sporomusa sp.]HWR44694.1 methyl-accepting chemotaxis protein [Sporomusa sp.]
MFRTIADLKMGVKISLSLIFILGLLGIISGTSIFSSYALKAEIQEIEVSNQRAILAAKAENEYTGAVLEIRRFIADGDDKYSKNFEEKLNNVLALETQLLELTAGENKKKIEKLVQDTTSYKKGVTEQLIPILRQQFIEKQAGNTLKYNDLTGQSALVTRSLTPFAQTIQKTLHAAMEENSKIAADKVRSAQKRNTDAVFTAVTIGIISLLAGVALSIILTKMVTRPIQAVTGQLDQMAEGNYTGHIDAQLLKRGDEFGNVAASLAHLQQNTRVLLLQVQQGAEHLAASSEQLTASAEQSAQATQQVAVTISQVAAGVEQQVTAVDTTVVIVEEISASIQYAAVNASGVTGVSEQAAHAVQAGTQSIAAAVEQMDSIEKTVAGSAGVVAKLGERSKEIGQIVDTISGIAGQTNLLALNAAIEAARAGEQGRGFAVVAEEVRKLAEQSQLAAKQIADLIKEIQTDTEKAVLAMADGTREVKVGSEVVGLAGKSFNDIAALITQVSAQIKEISASIHQMSAGSQQIVKAVHTVDSVSKDTAGQTQTVSAATEEQAASMQEIASSSQVLAKMAEELQESVKKFKV